MAKADKTTQTASTANPSVDPNAGLPDFSTWSEEATGFAPYWNPEENAWFFARIIDKDERDPSFVRFLMQAGHDIPCKRGPAEEAEDVMVNKGEFFTISVYYSLQDLFDFYLELARTGALTPTQQFMRIMAIDKSKTKAGQKVWNWKVLVDPQTKLIANQARAKLAQLGAGAKAAKGQLAPVPDSIANADL